jgi:subfamily B ATP-binding cassette protein HlyB/CyaB
VLASVPIYVAISLVVTPILRRRLEEKFALGAEYHAFLVESVHGMETVKAMAVEPRMERRWEDLLAAYVRTAFRSTTLASAASQGVGLVNKLTTGVTLWLGARLAIDGGLTVGELVAFNMLANRVTAPVLRLAQLWQDFQQVRISVERLGDILNTPAETVDGAGRTTLPAIEGRVTFGHVSFRYRSEARFVLDDVSLDIAPGEVIGIVGPSGSGKSTLAKLVQRLYVPERGRVLVDGIDLALVDPAWLRRQIGVVLQDSVLFNRTVRDNIALADPGMDLAHVLRVARLAGAHEFVTELPQGYDTVIGERGATLSGGQRQRIAIARALAGDPRILILDEATSALDYESERSVQENMRAICRGRTVVVIAHRLTTVRGADRILTLEAGRIVEDGTHAELVARGGRYASLHRLQAGLR